MTMAPSIVASERNVECAPRTKVKTGCATCRIRKVKCDEKKPSCQKCVNTGRTCDGYEDRFRLFSTSQSFSHNACPNSHTLDSNLKPMQPILFIDAIIPQDIYLLSRCFSTKTMFDVKLGCDEEARQILHASLTDPPIRHAILSLRALRTDLETSGDGPESVARPTMSYNYGIQQYSIALGNLASKLSSPSSSTLKSALFCCQIFISIEQVQKNYAAMAQHIIRGLRIMHEYRTRPYFDAANKLVAAHYGQLPFLDVFIIKLFAAPCKFTDSPAANNNVSRSVCQQSVGCHGLPTIAPDMRTQLTRIAASTLEFLSNVSQVESVEIALRLLSEKTALLDCLESWLIALKLVQTETRSPDPELVSISFQRLFHSILKIVLLGALDSAPEIDTELGIEYDRLQSLANIVGERVRTYITCNGGPSSGPENPFTVL